MGRLPLARRGILWAVFALLIGNQHHIRARLHPQYSKLLAGRRPAKVVDALLYRLDEGVCGRAVYWLIHKGPAAILENTPDYGPAVRRKVNGSYVCRVAIILSDAGNHPS